MKYFKLRRILKKVSGTSVIVVGIPLIILTNCSRTTNTINPFYSSFEENSDHNPLINDITAAENVENLTTTVDTGPIHGYNLAKKTDDTGFGFTGFRAFEYACLSKNANQHTKFIANIYDNLNITIGKNTELSYKLFPNMGNNQKPALLDINYPAENIIVDLLINDSADTKNLITLSSLKLNDENGFQYTPINQGQSKILMNDQ
jgi:hypothetical protein